jgi:hypothetical protein
MPNVNDVESNFLYSYAEWHYAWCHFRGCYQAECHYASATISE